MGAVLAVVDRVQLLWTVLTMLVLPTAFIVWATWFIWRAGRKRSRDPGNRDPGKRDTGNRDTRILGTGSWARRSGSETVASGHTEAARWLAGSCRECGFGSPVHTKTGLCHTCHNRPLPDRTEVPSHLPDSL